MKKYRRIEVNAYHRRITVVSGEWRPDGGFNGEPAQTDDSVSLNDTDSCEPVEPDSPEGQLILVEAVRSLEQRLTPKTRALISSDQNIDPPNGSTQNGLFFKLHSFFQFIWSRAIRFAR